MTRRSSSAPAGPAAAVYTGVLYDRLRLPELPKRAQGRVLIASALWGVLRPADRIPYYRFSAKARLDGIGGLAAFWRPALAAALPDKDGTLVVDMRSGAYSAAWKPKRADAGRRPRLQRGEGQAQTGEPHGEGGPRRSRASAAGGEESRRSPPRPPRRSPRPPASPSSSTPGNLDVIVPA